MHIESRKKFKVCKVRYKEVANDRRFTILYPKFLQPLTTKYAIRAAEATEGTIVGGTSELHASRSFVRDVDWVLV